MDLHMPMLTRQIRHEIDLMSHRQALLTLLKNGLIPADRLDDAIVVSGIHPSGSQWFRFLDRLLLILGVLFIALAVIFFFAYNWTELGRLAKFAVAETALIITMAIYLRADRNSLLSQSMLLGAALLTGALLALFGQTYQTGADPWQLFFSWALLITPWVVIARFPILWLLWLALLNLTASLYFGTFGVVSDLLFLPFFASENAPLWCLSLLNTIALSLWELASAKFEWLKPRWAPRLIAIAGGLPITWLALMHILDARDASIYAIPIWILWAAGLYLFYRIKKPDLFMLAGFALALSVVLITYIAEPLFTLFGSAAFLIVATLIIGAGSGAALWLRRVHQSWST